MCSLVHNVQFLIIGKTLGYIVLVILQDEKDVQSVRVPLFLEAGFPTICDKMTIKLNLVL